MKSILKITLLAGLLGTSGAVSAQTTDNAPMTTTERVDYNTNDNDDSGKWGLLGLLGLLGLIGLRNRDDHRQVRDTHAR